MNERIPRTPFSTPLSGSAKVAELRLKNIFSGPKKRPPALFLALMFSVCLLCGNLVSCQVAQPETPDISQEDMEPSTADISIPEDASSGEVLQLLLSGGSVSPTEELREAFTVYYSENSYELRYLPSFSPDQPPDWDDLTLYVAIMESYHDPIDSVHTGISADLFREIVRCCLGDLDYTDQSSAYLTYENGLYTYTGWDTNGAVYYRLTGLSQQGDIYTASFDGVEFWETDFIDGEDMISPNMQAVRDAVDVTSSDWSVLSPQINTLLLREDYDRIFTVDEQVQITFRLSGGPFSPFVYLSCDRQRLDFDPEGPFPQTGQLPLEKTGDAQGKIAVDSQEKDPDDKKDIWNDDDWSWADKMNAKDWDDGWDDALEAEYQAVGVTMDGKNYYYQGQLVNIFLDIRPNKSFYTLDMDPAGAVNIKMIRDADNKITGVAYMTEAEAAELLADMRD